MKNKKIYLIICFIINLIASNNLLSEEIYFETPEIEIFNNGNLIKAAKGGKAITDDNTEILAEIFEYDKINLILTATNNAQVIDDLRQITIKADKILYNKKNLIITAQKNVLIIDKSNKVILESNKVVYSINEEKISSIGHTKVEVEDKYLINSSDLTFLRNKMEIFSDKNSSLEDKENNFYTAESFKYLIEKKLFRGKKINIETIEKDNYFFEDGMVNLATKEIRGKDLEVNFDNGVFGNVENEPRLKGVTAYSNLKNTIVDKGVFTTCKRRKGKCPPWKIESKEVKHDKKKKTIYYKDAWLKIYDVPVLYYPRFFHPDPTVDRQSGFLRPQIGESQILGSSAYIPYFYVISHDKDLTFKPRIYNNNKYLLQTEYRQVTKNSENIFDFSLNNGHNSSKSSDKNTKEDSRTHFFSNSIIDLDLQYFDNSNIEIQFQKTSNDTYLKLFPLGMDSEMVRDANVNTMNSFFNFEANRENLTFDASFQVYEKLDKPNTDRYEFIFPNYNLNKTIDTNYELDGNLSLNSSGSQNFYNTNIYEAHIINDLLYQSEDKFFDNGIMNNYNILLKNVNSQGKNSSKYKDDFEAEILSTFLFQSSYPLLREGIEFNSYFTPKISLRYSPNNMKNLRNENRRVDVVNIWSLDRIASSETIESGQSFTLGGEYTKTNKEEDKDIIGVELAAVFRDEINENMPLTSSLRNESSDLIGKIDLSPNDFFNTEYNFSLDNNFDRLKYNKLSASFTVNNFITSFEYLEENDNIGDKHSIQNDTTFKINENSSFTFSTRKNKKIDLTEFYNLIYQYKNDCLTAAVNYKKAYYVDNDLQPTEQLFFSLTIVPLGDYETQNIIPN